MDKTDDDLAQGMATLSYGELGLFIAGLGRLAAEAVEELVRIRGDDKTAAKLLRDLGEESQESGGERAGVRATGGEQGGKLRIETRGFDWKLIGGFLNEVTAWNLRDPGIFGDVRSLLKAAEEGRVRRPRVTYPVRTQPDVGELRLDVRRQRYRIYFAEPPAPSRLVLALAFCKKLPHGDPAAKSTQNADMALAAAVYHLWLEQEHGT